MEDEWNVDLNRNFSTNDALYRTVNHAYAELSGIAEPHRPVFDVGTDSLNLSIATLVAYAQHGFSFAFISNGTHAGQYQFPQGFEYGGNSHQQQSEFLRRELTPVMQSHPGEILFLDLHTGLGSTSVLTVYSGNDWPQERVLRLKKFVSDLRDPGIRVEEPDASAFQTSGDVINFVPKLVAGDRVAAVTLEYGTIGASTINDLQTNARMILENEAHFYCCPSAAVCGSVKENFAELFNPSDTAWRLSVVERANRNFCGSAKPVFDPAISRCEQHVRWCKAVASAGGPLMTVLSLARVSGQLHIG
jgi:hypothetical protein